MCRHLETRPAYLDEEPGPVADREAEDLLCDMAEALELSRGLLQLADGHWRECAHSGCLALEGILRDCAHRITIEALRSRMKLEASGRVKFGLAFLEESADDGGPDPAAESTGGEAHCSANPPQDPATRILPGVSEKIARRETGPPPLGTLRRPCASFAAGTAPGRPAWPADGPRQGGT